MLKLHTSDLHTKISHRIQHICFHRALQKFELINVYCFLLKRTALQIDAKFGCIFKLHRSDLHTKISHRIEHIYFLQGTSKTLMH